MAVGMGVNNQMVALSPKLEAFRAFAQSGVSDDQAAQMCGSTVQKAWTTATAASRLFRVTSNAKAATKINNDVRAWLVRALQDQFDVTKFEDLPESVKSALKGTHASTAEEDFGLVKKGKVTSGRPLTRRRINAVLTAVEEVVRQCAQARVVTPEMLAETMRQGASTRALSKESLAERTAPEAVEVFAATVAKTLVGNNKGIFHRLDMTSTKDQVKQFVEGKLCHLGDSEGEHLLSDLLRKFCNGPLQSCGVLAESNPLVLQVVVREAFVGAIWEYNRAHPKSAYPV